MLCAVVTAATPFPRAAVERFYSRGLYPFIQPRLTALSNAVPFALLDAALLVVLGGGVVLWTIRLRRARKRRLRVAGALLLETITAATLLYGWFLMGWGLNYQREPLRAQLDFQPARVTTTEVRALAVRGVDALNALFDAAHRERWPEFRGMAPALGPAFARAQADLGMAWRATPGMPKRSLLDFYFRRVSVDGLTDPFFLETLVNQSLLPFERPFVVAHEWSHLAGYADESEANFLAWLICMRGDPAAQYSAWISLYGTIVSALPPDARAPVVARLAAGPRRDVRAVADRIARQVNPAASRAGYAVYDRFLKANRVEAGVESYSEAIQLMVGTRFRPDGSPILKRGAS